MHRLAGRKFTKMNKVTFIGSKTVAGSHSRQVYCTKQYTIFCSIQRWTGGLILTDIHVYIRGRKTATSIEMEPFAPTIRDCEMWYFCVFGGNTGSGLGWGLFRQTTESAFWVRSVDAGVCLCDCICLLVSVFVCLFILHLKHLFYYDVKQLTEQHWFVIKHKSSVTKHSYSISFFDYNVLSKASVTQALWTSWQQHRDISFLKCFCFT